MIEVIFSNLKQDLKKSSYFYTEKISSCDKFWDGPIKSLTTPRFGTILKNSFADLEDYANWKNSLNIILKYPGIDWEGDSSIEELDEFDNYLEKICGIAWNPVKLGDKYLKHLNNEKYELDFTFLPEMTIIRFIDKKTNQAKLKVKLLGDIYTSFGDKSTLIYNFPTYFKEFFINLFYGMPTIPTPSQKWKSTSFQFGENPIDRLLYTATRINTEDETENRVEKILFPIFQEILGKLLIELIVYNYYKEEYFDEVSRIRVF